MKLYQIYGLVSLTLLFNACTEQKKMKNDLFTTSGVNSRFNFDTTKSFEAYIQYSRAIIESGRLDLNSKNRDQIISWNMPFMLKGDSIPKGKKKGLVIAHGLGDSPFSIRFISEYFNKKGFTVYAILLTGHGTRSGDLKEVSYTDWVKQFEYGVNEISKEVEGIYVGGFSLGGTIALNYLASNPKKNIKGAILLSPALGLTFLARFASLLKYFKPVWELSNEDNIVHYESTMTNGGAQVYNLISNLDKENKKNGYPLKKTKIFGALSYEDETIDAKKTLQKLIEYTDPEKRSLTLYSRSQLPQDFIHTPNLHFINSKLKDKKILDMSHVAIPFSPNDPWYGVNGTYKNCNHYKKASKDYKLCKSLKSINMGETSERNLSLGVLARLNYNPFMEQLLKKLDSFLAL